MFTFLGRFVVARRRLVLTGTAAFLVLAGAVGGSVASRLTSGGFVDPGSESSRAADVLEAELGQATPNLILLVRAEDGRGVDEPEVADLGEALAAELAGEPGISRVESYWSLGRVPPLRSEDGTQALVLAVIPGGEDRVEEVAEELSPRYTRDTGVATVAVGGFAEVFRQVNTQVETDLVRAELIAFPVTLLLLLVVFGSLVAAGLPLAVGAIAISGTLLVLWLVAAVTDVSIFALNITTSMGLGLAIDYSLFVVSRYREELRRGLDPHPAVVRTVETAGKTVAFSAMTVAISLAALVIYPLAFLRSFAYAGIAVALVAAGGAVLFLPALLAVLGRRVDALTLWRRAHTPDGEGAWHRAATFVMGRPLPVALAVVALLVALGLPFLHIRFGLPDDRVLPAGASSREVHDALRDDFSSSEAGTLQVVATGIGDPRERTADIDAYAVELSRVDGVARVDALTGSYVDGVGFPVPDGLTDRFLGDDATWLSVVPSVEPISPEGEALTEAVRDLPSPLGETAVAGLGAELVDSKQALFDRTPIALGWIAVATFVLLFLMFGSVLVPLKALALNVLSLSATFGALVWVFQDGHLAGLLGFTPTGTLVASVPVLMFCVAFGLSMDYEVFLLSRIKEEYDRSGDNTTSVALGLERTGRIVTAAAVLISVVFVAFASSGVTFVKMFGIGLALAVLIDAFVIRATLVPAFMRLAGRANWWAPPRLRRIHERFGFGEVGVASDEPPELVEAGAR
ncbi:MAG: MMPL family transporter [Acidimicrobiia bacterium]|nr:MMPL family transporter [Acidimicrobiia bacterium]